MVIIRSSRSIVLLIFSVLPITVHAEETRSYSAAVTHSYPTQVYWGDTHVHTQLSWDAYNLDNRLTPEEAYRFAKGEEITDSNGMRIRLRRPLDFLVVTDHSENLGAFLALHTGDPQLLQGPAARKMNKRLDEVDRLREVDPGKAEALSVKLHLAGLTEGVLGDPAFIRSVWNTVTAIADQNNKPGKFTAFIGYEWTSWGVGNDLSTMHRNLIFKDDAMKANRIVPFTSYDSSDPEDLWRWMESYEKQTNGEVLAIPHNANLSGGQAFSLLDQQRRPLSKAYSVARSRWEPLYEVTQIKGDSETHPALSPEDEFADFETWDFFKESPQTLPYEYARSGLKLGLDQQARLGANPFKFGLVGSSDSHTGLTAIDEEDFSGKFPSGRPSPLRLSDELGIDFTISAKRSAYNLPEEKKLYLARHMSAAGRAAVWAEENTREALFAAMKRRETYATTGPRMTVRFFGGWDYQKGDAFRPDLATIGYSKGVPMGGDLTGAPEGKPPTFLIRAVRDPDGANLDRVQIIKGWRSADGELHEKIHDVALSDERRAGRDGKVPPVGSTVNVSDASYTNKIGDPELSVVWKDLDFDPAELAFYYVRVIEIPTPRWTTYDAKAFGVTDIPEDVPATTQERAYTSPIWYIP